MGLWYPKEEYCNLFWYNDSHFSGANCNTPKIIKNVIDIVISILSYFDFIIIIIIIVIIIIINNKNDYY